MPLRDQTGSPCEHADARDRHIHYNTIKRQRNRDAFGIGAEALLLGGVTLLGFASPIWGWLAR